MLSSVRIDRQQMSETWNRALATAAHTGPVQQFGIGFGIGWCVCVCVCVCVRARVRECVYTCSTKGSAYSRSNGVVYIVQLAISSHKTGIWGLTWVLIWYMHVHVSVCVYGCKQTSNGGGSGTLQT